MKEPKHISVKILTKTENGIRKVETLDVESKLGMYYKSEEVDKIFQAFHITPEKIRTILDGRCLCCNHENGEDYICFKCGRNCAF
jgi:hypothetical protein